MLGEPAAEAGGGFSAEGMRMGGDVAVDGGRGAIIARLDARGLGIVREPQGVVEILLPGGGVKVRPGMGGEPRGPCGGDPAEVWVGR